MKTLSKNFTKILFYFVSIVLMIWTGRMTLDLLTKLLPEMMFAGIFGLILFEGGMLSWLYMFINGAEGQGQRMVAIALTGLDFIGICLVGVVELYTSGQNFTDIPEGLPTLALWTVVIATILNLGGVVLYHILDPIAQEKIAFAEQRAKLMVHVFEDFDQTVDAQASVISKELADRMNLKLLKELEVHSGSGQPETRTNLVLESQKPEPLQTWITEDFDQGEPYESPEPIYRPNHNTQPAKK